MTTEEITTNTVAEKDLHPNEYILFVWGIYKRPEHYSGLDFEVVIKGDDSVEYGRF